jgi:hypothetical protein
MPEMLSDCKQTTLQRFHFSIFASLERRFDVAREVSGRDKKGVLAIAQQLQRTYAAIAMHVRSNCNARTHQLLWGREKAVFRPSLGSSCVVKRG